MRRFHSPRLRHRPRRRPLHPHCRRRHRLSHRRPRHLREISADTISSYVTYTFDTDAAAVPLNAAADISACLFAHHNIQLHSADAFVSEHPHAP